jgi:ubiquinone biosynthesis protein
LIAKSKRYRAVVGAIITFGFGTYIANPWLRRLGFRRQNNEESKIQRWKKFRQLLETLGPTYIKFGQIISNRPGILPDKLLEELALLQDRVPPFPTQDAIALIEYESKKTMAALFSSFGEAPVASASIAQVYEAKLHDGTRVAVKVRRPNIEQIIRADVAIMKDLARLMQRSKPSSAPFSKNWILSANKTTSSVSAVCLKRMKRFLFRRYSNPFPVHRS